MAKDCPGKDDPGYIECIQKKKKLAQRSDDQVQRASGHLTVPAPSGSPVDIFMGALKGKKKKEE